MTKEEEEKRLSDAVNAAMRSVHRDATMHTVDRAMSDLYRHRETVRVIGAYLERAELFPYDRDKSTGENMEAFAAFLLHQTRNPFPHKAQRDGE